MLTARDDNSILVAVLDKSGAYRKLSLQCDEHSGSDGSKVIDIKINDQIIFSSDVEDLEPLK